MAHDTNVTLSENEGSALAIASAELLDEHTARSVANMFAALADPTRVRIISALSHCELPVGDLADLLGMEQSAVSHQLRRLRKMRLVRNRREGKQVFYTLDDDHIHDVFHRVLDHVEHE